MKYLISGGGTGGHIFPAISIAKKITEKDKEAVILFIGAKDRMEMQVVPKHGFKIVGLPIKGIDRKHILKNIKVLCYFFYSLFLVNRVIKEFRPDVAIGVGGYASAAALKVAAKRKIPILLQEQNSYAGITNKILRNDAQYICVAYEGMERFFPKNKIVLTGNPVRSDLLNGSPENAQHLFFPNAHDKKKTLLILGGSLGAKTINQAVITELPQLLKSHIQIIWQTGKNYLQTCQVALRQYTNDEQTTVFCNDFIQDMADAYALADLVIARAGAGTIAELCLLGKPAILVPSPNVAEDHQTHNALALVNKKAAEMITDHDAPSQLIKKAIQMMNDNSLLTSLSQNISKLAHPNATEKITEICIRLTQQRNV